ncbi:MAG: UDP-N-acetylmuramate dehydrogenase [Patescibacteria group bacterium]|nr:UDP-N-acetylmuramate dehydrogenase [Patescibacteria group bacterium]
MRNQVKNIKNNYSLKRHNTFGLDVKSRYFIQLNYEDEFYEILADKYLSKQNIIILGDGANVLFTRDFDGLVIGVKIKGMKIVEENQSFIVVEVGAGKNWHELVTWAVNHNYGGIENLALIPGTVGAAPVQNIAAYGQNFEDVFVSLDAINLKTGLKKTFEKSECDFDYRESFFKNGKGKRQWLITKVRLRLSKKPVINASYFETGRTVDSKNKISIISELNNLGKVKPFTIRDIYDAVLSIRLRKLPDIKKLGNAGSVFKNPLVTKRQYEDLLRMDSSLQCYPANSLSYFEDSDSLDQNEYVKIPAGRLLDNLGWRGKRIGKVGVYEKHALIVVNYGDATPDEILNLISLMKADVYENYGINLELELVTI